MTQRTARPLWRKVAAAIGGTLLTALLLAVFYLTVVLCQPQEDMTDKTDLDQPLLAPSPAIDLAAGQAIDAAVAGFPVPALCCAQGGGLTMTGGSCYDTAFEDGVARILTLNYADAQGHTLQVTSIYPARALALITDSTWRLTGAGPSLAGNNTVQMEKEQSVRLHMQTSAGLYVVTTQKQDRDALRELLRPLQLLGGAQEE